MILFSETPCRLNLLNSPVAPLPILQQLAVVGNDSRVIL